MSECSLLDLDLDLDFCHLFNVFLIRFLATFYVQMVSSSKAGEYAP